jgi:chromosome segregation ATPase
MSSALKQGSVTEGGKPPSLNEFLDQFEGLLSEKHELTVRLTKALVEIKELTGLYHDTRAQLESLTSQNAELRAKLQDAPLRLEKDSGNEPRANALASARERLMRDEFERKFQDLTLEVKKMRNKYEQQVHDLQTQLSNCICKASGRR